MLMKVNETTSIMANHLNSNVSFQRGTAKQWPELRQSNAYSTSRKAVIAAKRYHIWPEQCWE